MSHHYVSARRYNYSQKSKAYEDNVDIWRATNVWYIDGPGRFIETPPPAVKYNVNSFSYLKKAQDNENEDNDNDNEDNENEDNDNNDNEDNDNADNDNEMNKNSENSDNSEGHKKGVACEISVINEDSFVVAAICWDEGYSPMVLNMANATQPGGGVYKGSMAQEEDLFRRSNYFLAAPSKHYPLNAYEVLYSPRVTVHLGKDYSLLESVQSYACLACAAERDPSTLPNPEDPLNVYDRIYENPETAEATRKKILGLFRIGIDQGHDCLVLGSLGCGAFNNPQMRIIEYFNEGIRMYHHYFGKIVFAVLSKDDPNFGLFDKYIIKNVSEARVPGPQAQVSQPLQSAGTTGPSPLSLREPQAQVSQPLREPQAQVSQPPQEPQVVEDGGNDRHETRYESGA